MALVRSTVSASNTKNTGKAAPGDKKSSAAPASAASREEAKVKSPKSMGWNYDEISKNVMGNNDPVLAAYQAALTMGQQSGAETEEELFDYMDQVLPNILRFDREKAAEGKNLSAEQIANLNDPYAGLTAKDIQRHYTGANAGTDLVDFLGDSVDNINKGAGGVIDWLGDNITGNVIGAFNPEAGQQWKDFADGEDVAGVLSGAEDIGLWLVPGAGPFLAAGKAALDNRDNISRAVSGRDPLTLEMITPEQRATNAGAAAFDIALSSLPGMGVGKAVVKQAGKKASKEAASAADDLAKIVKANDDDLANLAKKYEIKMPEGELTNETRGKLVQDIQKAAREADEKAAKELVDEAQAARSGLDQDVNDAVKLASEERAKATPTNMRDYIAAEQLVREARAARDTGRQAADEAIENARKFGQEAVESGQSNLARKNLLSTLNERTARQRASEADEMAALFNNADGAGTGVVDRLSKWRPFSGKGSGSSGRNDVVKQAQDYLRGYSDRSKSGIDWHQPLKDTAKDIRGGALQDVRPLEGPVDSLRAFGRRMRGGTRNELDEEAARLISEGSGKIPKRVQKQIDKLKKSGKEDEAKKLEEGLKSGSKSYDKALANLSDMNAIGAALARARANGFGPGRLVGDFGEGMVRGVAGMGNNALQLAAAMGTDPSTALQDFAALQQDGAGVNPALALALIAPGPKRYVNRLLGGGKRSLPYHAARMNIMNDMMRMNPAISSAIPTQEAVDFVNAKDGQNQAAQQPAANQAENGQGMTLDQIAQFIMSLPNQIAQGVSNG